eukprot:scaffold15327_cov58-Attheya_sp.AAC.6
MEGHVSVQINDASSVREVYHDPSWLKRNGWDRLRVSVFLLYRGHLDPRAVSDKKFEILASEYGWA